MTLPADTTASKLSDISCSSDALRDRTVAPGAARRRANAAPGQHHRRAVQHRLAEPWNGTAWTRLSVPDPSASGFSDPYLADVSCVTCGTTDNLLYGISCTTSCMAVGGSVYSSLSGIRPWWSWAREPGVHAKVPPGSAKVRPYDVQGLTVA
jgi:hypothetical protein